eukprot:TRINITY_DN1533_c0_g1_i1.p1 TRINITY_DN1533_c0_g1~~TRINITY_DN1533_c0_g1_i1.p1  ORF type:complete len:326 (-),score=74.41 TRINITY_DN1533_c0_g1_i1:75-1052(-)
MSDAKTVFVGGISPKASEESLGQFFETNFGEVTETKIIFDRNTGRSKGYGFVTFDSSETAEVVKKSNSLIFLGKMMNVGSAYRKSPQNQNHYNNNMQYGHPGMQQQQQQQGPGMMSPYVFYPGYGYYPYWPGQAGPSGSPTPAPGVPGISDGSTLLPGSAGGIGDGEGAVGPDGVRQGGQMHPMMNWMNPAFQMMPMMYPGMMGQPGQPQGGAGGVGGAGGAGVPGYPTGYMDLRASAAMMSGAPSPPPSTTTAPTSASSPASASATGASSSTAPSASASVSVPSANAEPHADTSPSVSVPIHEASSGPAEWPTPAQAPGSPMVQ